MELGIIILYNHELCGQHWICNERARIRGALETVYGPNAVTHTRSDDVRQSYFKSTSFTWPFFGER